MAGSAQRLHGAAWRRMGRTSSVPTSEESRDSLPSTLTLVAYWISTAGAGAALATGAGDDDVFASWGGYGERKHTRHGERKRTQCLTREVLHGEVRK